MERIGKDRVLETVRGWRDDARMWAERCVTCEAPRLWWHALELERLYDACSSAKDADAPEADPGEAITCPQCGLPVHKVPLAGGHSTWPFWCPQCGELLLDVIKDAPATCPNAVEKPA